MSARTFFNFISAEKEQRRRVRREEIMWRHDFGESDSGTLVPVLNSFCLCALCVSAARQRLCVDGIQKEIRIGRSSAQLLISSGCFEQFRWVQGGVFDLALIFFGFEGIGDVDQAVRGEHSRSKLT